MSKIVNEENITKEEDVAAKTAAAFEEENKDAVDGIVDGKEVSGENKMGTMPMNKLLLGMSLPMMASMLVQSLYNIVDSIFVAKLSEDALTAVSLAFPVQVLTMAVGGGTGVGINAVLSKALGEKNQDAVNKSATNGVFLMVLSYFLFLLIGIFFVKPFYYMQGTESPLITEYGIQYLTIACCCSIGVFTQVTFERLLQSTGKTVLSMITQATGAVINLILDPIMIFGLLGCPKLGVAGAALATVIGQIVAGCLAIFLNQKYNKEIRISFQHFKPDFKMIGKIYSVGFPSIIMQSIGSIMNYCMNQVLLSFTDTAATVFGVYYKLQSFFFMPVFGLNNGLVPIVAYNFGAGKRSRMIKSIKLGVLYAEMIFIAGTLSFLLVPEFLLGFFDAKGDLLTMGTIALRTIAIHFPMAAFCIICSSTFQALGHGMYSMWVSIARQLAVLIPVAYLFSLSGNVNLVWWAFPIAELASLIMSTIFLVRVYKKTIRYIPDNV